MFKSLEDMLIAAAEAVRPPERLSISQAAVKYRKLNNPGSYIGDYDLTFAPYLVDVQDTFTSTLFESVIFVGPARCGKSDLFLNWGTHTVVCDPADMMVVHMTQSTARDWSQSDLAKLFRHSPDVGARLKSGKQNDNVFDKNFTSGMRMLIKWPTVSELSGKTLPRCWLMDYDRMPDDVEGEGSPFQMTIKRNETFGRFGMTVAESSPGREVMNSKWVPTSPHEAPPVSGGILPLYNRGDRRRWNWQCIACGHAFEPSFRLLDYPDSADAMESAEQATLLCPHCSHRYWHNPEEQGGEGPSKNEMNQLHRNGGHAAWVIDGQTWAPDGQFYGTPARSKSASFWLKGPAAAFSNWQKLVFNYLKGLEEYEKTGAEETLKTTINLDQGEPYTPKSRENDRVPETLKARARDLGLRKVPLGVRFLVSTIDVQKNRFVVQVHGIGVGGDIYIVDRYEIRKSQRLDDDGDRATVNPGAYLEDWKLLVDKVLLKTYPLSDGSGRHMQVKHAFCDSGGREGVTSNAYDFWRYLRDECETPGLHQRFRLVKGTSTRGAPRVKQDFPDSQRKDRHAGARGEVPVLFLQSNQLKDQLDHLLDRTTPEGGMIHFPDWLPDNFYVELTVEVRSAKGEWENPQRKRNESWDLLYYCLGGITWNGIAIELLDWTNPPGWAGEWETNDLIFDPETGDKRFEAKAKPTDFGSLAKQLA